MDSINLLIASGIIERVTLRFREDGTAVCAGSLRLEEASPQGITYKTWLQLEAYAPVQPFPPTQKPRVWADAVEQQQLGLTPVPPLVPSEAFPPPPSKRTWERAVENIKFGRSS